MGYVNTVCGNKDNAEANNKTKIYRNKNNARFYVINKEVDEKKASFICFNDKYAYTIPYEDMEFWMYV